MTLRDVYGSLFWSFIFFASGLALFNEGDTAEKENWLRRQMPYWPKASAKIEKAHVRYKKNSGTITATYTYRYNGSTYTSNNVGLYDSDEAVELFRENLEFASRIDCFVNPSNPSEAYLFNNQTEDSSPIGYRLGGFALMALGVVIFYFSFIHGFFQKKSVGSKEKVSTSTASAPNVSSDQRSNSYSLPQSSASAPKKIRKNKVSIEGLAKIINKYIIRLNFKCFNEHEKCKLEAIIWLFCVSQLVIRDAYTEATKKQNKFAPNRIHVDHIRLRSVSFACIAVLQHLGVSSLNLRELSKLYWNRFSTYAETKKDYHFITLFSLLLNEVDGDREEKANKITISAINKYTLSLCNSLASDLLKWMVSFFQNKGFDEVYDYSVALFEDHAQWITGLKDKHEGKVYVCCNGCSILHEVNEIDDLDCPDCRAWLRKYKEEQDQQGYFIKLNVKCKRCGSEYRERYSDLHRHLLCYTCFSQFSNNFASLQKRLAITKK